MIAIRRRISLLIFLFIHVFNPFQPTAAAASTIHNNAAIIHSSSLTDEWTAEEIIQKRIVRSLCKKEVDQFHSIVYYWHCEPGKPGYTVQEERA
jgi:hypothetical protein